MARGGWCQDRLKGNALDMCAKAYLRKDFLSSTQSETGGYKSMDSQSSMDNGATVNSRDRQSDHGVCDQMEPVLHGRAQENTPIYGFPGLAKMGRAQWCTGELKVNGINSKTRVFSDSARSQGADINIVQYLGIAADEPKRIARHTKAGVILPLVEAGWDESYCRKWCEENDLLSPIYTTSARGGCWFCHNQSLDQLRLLRKDYPDLWALLMKWDLDSPVTFKADGHTVHDYDRRFQAEDDGIVPMDRKFRWKMLENDDSASDKTEVLSSEKQHPNG